LATDDGFTSRCNSLLAKDIRELVHLDHALRPDPERARTPLYQ